MITDEDVTIEVASRHADPFGSKQLVAAARSGSAAAFAELREVYAQRVYRKLLIITKNREDAEDAFAGYVSASIQGVAHLRRKIELLYLGHHNCDQLCADDPSQTPYPL